MRLSILATATIISVQLCRAQVPVNDICSDAITIACGASVAGSTLEANDDIALNCGTNITAPGVWYTFTGIAGEVVITTCNAADYDNKINVYSGTCSAIVCVTGNDDAPGCGLTAQVSFMADAAETYHVLVQGYNGATGDFTLTMECITCNTPGTPQLLVTDVEAIVNWSAGNPGATFVLEHGPSGFDPGTGSQTIGIVGVDGPPVTIADLEPGSFLDLYLYEDCGGDDLSAVIGPIEFITLDIAPAPNALCQNAVPITCATSVTGNTTEGLFTSGPHCGSGNITTKGLWYTFVGTGTEVELSTCGDADFDTKISVFSGSCSDPICAAGNDDSPGCSANRSRVTLITDADVIYHVLVHGFGQNQGSFTLDMTCDRPCTPAISNDICPDAVALELQYPGLCTPTAGTTVCAYAPAFPAPACNPYGNIADTWYQFNTGISTMHTIDLAAVGTTPLNMALYTACGQQQYLECFMNVTGSLEMEDLPSETDILVRVWNGGGPQAGAFTICVEGDLNTGVSTDIITSPRLMPVPAHDLLTAEGFPANAILEVFDLRGRAVPVQARTDGDGRAILTVAGLSPGIHVLRCHTDGAVHHVRFVKE